MAALPEPEQACQLFDRLLQVSAEMLQASQANEVSRLSELMAERGKLLNQAQQLPLTEYPEAVQAELRTRLAALNKLQAAMGQSMHQSLNELEQQIQQGRKQKSMLGHYRLDLDEETTSSSRSNEA